MPSDNMSLTLAISAKFHSNLFLCVRARTKNRTAILLYHWMYRRTSYLKCYADNKRNIIYISEKLAPML